MTVASKVTILRLLADVGTRCAAKHDEHVRNLQSERVQMGETWALVGVKDRQVTNGADGYGSAWAWVAIDADSKLADSPLTGQRDADSARAFVRETADRIDSRVQLTSDGFGMYRDAVDQAFEAYVDYAQLVKEFGRDMEDHRRYSPPVCIGTTQIRRCGEPDPAQVSTSFVKRQNFTLGMQSRRMTRLTNAFSKRFENLIHALNLHYRW